MGYDPQSFTANLKQNMSYNFVLKEESSKLDEVVITAEKPNENITKSQMGVEKITMKEKEKGSFMISARRTYADLFLKLSSDSATNQSTLYFYDLNVKANYRINDRNRIYLSGY